MRGEKKTNAKSSFETSKKRTLEGLHDGIANGIVAELDRMHGNVDKEAKDVSPLRIFARHDRRDDPLRELALIVEELEEIRRQHLVDVRKGDEGVLSERKTQHLSHFDCAKEM